MNKHASKYTADEVYALSDRALLAGRQGHLSGDEMRALLTECGSVLLNREIRLTQIRLTLER